MKYGYPWVSTESQKNNSSIKAQKEEFIKAGVPEENIRVEVESSPSSPAKILTISRSSSSVFPNEISTRSS